MDKQLEERIRQRAYELWMQHGSLPGRADEYWYQAEREIVGDTDAQSASDVDGGTATDVGLPPILGGSENQEALDTNPSPLGMVSETSDEVLSAPAAPKTRKKRSPAAPAPTEETGETGGAAPKRRRSARTT